MLALMPPGPLPVYILHCFFRVVLTYLCKLEVASPFRKVFPHISFEDTEDKKDEINKGYIIQQ